MLAQARVAVEAAGVGDRIRLMIGEAEHLPFPDAQFDAATFTYLLRYVGDPAATLREIARVVRTGARNHRCGSACWSAHVIGMGTDDAVSPHEHPRILARAPHG